jgi:hypothetical protein
MNTETGLYLERLRRNAMAEVQATRCDPDLSDQEKQQDVQSETSGVNEEVSHPRRGAPTAGFVFRRGGWRCSRRGRRPAFNVEICCCFSLAGGRPS